MQTLGSIEKATRMACPHCNNLLRDEDVEAALEGEIVNCPYCGGAIKLPKDVVEKHQRSKYLGRSLDITC